MGQTLSEPITDKVRLFLGMVFAFCFLIAANFFYTTPHRIWLLHTFEPWLQVMTVNWVRGKSVKRKFRLSDQLLYHCRRQHHFSLLSTFTVSMLFAWQDRRII